MVATGGGGVPLCGRGRLRAARRAAGGTHLPHVRASLHATHLESAMSGRRGRGGGTAGGRITSGGRSNRLVVIGGGRGAAGAGRGAGGPPKTLNERFSALAAAPSAKRKAQGDQRVADARFAKVCAQHPRAKRKRSRSPHAT